MIDVDAHHGNGTQAIFYDDPDVLVGSVHVDPGAGWFPHFLGFADETGRAARNRNVPLAPGAGDDAWLAAVRELARLGAAAPARSSSRSASTPRAATPRARCEVTPAGFRAAGRALGALGLPTVVVQEGGYDLDTIGALVREFLAGLEEGTAWLSRCGSARTSTRASARSRARTSSRRRTGAWRRSRRRRGRTR